MLVIVNSHIIHYVPGVPTKILSIKFGRLKNGNVKCNDMYNACMGP